MSDEQLLSDLTKWARDVARIEPDEFACRYYERCNASIHGKLKRGETCMMSYVGRQYGSGAASDLQLVIIGMDQGNANGQTFLQRRSCIEYDYQRGHSGFNPHYKGVVKTAAAVFGPSGKFCSEHCTSRCLKSQVGEGVRCVIDRIVQPNNVKCAPSGGNMTSKVTRKMKVNCSNHLASELRLLRPTVVVFHGAGARWAVPPQLRGCL